MRNIEITKEYLKTLSNDELQELLNHEEQKAEELNTKQMAFKVMINSIYGAIGNETFFIYNPNIANAITGNSRFYINLMANNVNNYMKTFDSQDHWIYGDTDSVVYDTLITVNNKKIKIGDFYENSNGSEIKNKNNNFVKFLNSDYLTPSANRNFQIEDKKIKYVMKHKVRKHFYKIKIKDREVIITEDHSIMVKRNNKLISIKPKEILKTDKLLYLTKIK